MITDKFNSEESGLRS
jgi:prenyltransferase beta subunit